MQDKVISIMTIPDFSAEVMPNTKKIFLGYREKGVIIGGFYEDDVWKLTDEYSNVGFNFKIDSINEKYFDIYRCDKGQIVKWLKDYVLLKMGDLALSSLREFLCKVKQVLMEDPDTLLDNTQLEKYQGLSNISEFFSLMPVQDEKVVARDNLLERLDWLIDDGYSKMTTKARDLASFDSYFKFNDVIDDFWKNTKDESEKLFYFPVYLWWELSAIIPMRPREFILTPRHCLKKVDNTYYLTIRKDKLKGRNKTVSYQISSDYSLHTYVIPQRLGREIQWYIDKTNTYNDNQLETLFIADVHYEGLNCYIPSKSRYFTYYNMGTCLRYFFNEIVHERYGYKIVFDREADYLEDDEINFIYLGDTRHLALINIIYEGGSPAAAMVLAGQDDMNVSANYFSNISKMVECKVYRQYQKQIKGKQQYEISLGLNQHLQTGHFIQLDHGARCYSPNAAKGDYSDCYKMAGNDGEIGVCTNCTYYRPAGQAFFDAKDKYVNEINVEADALAKIIEQVRKSHGSHEDILQAMMKLQSAEYSYEQYLKEKMGKEKNGTSEEVHN